MPDTPFVRRQLAGVASGPCTSLRGKISSVHGGVDGHARKCEATRGYYRWVEIPQAAHCERPVTPE